jgi:protein-arginine kinase activator protein McsA
LIYDPDEGPELDELEAMLDYYIDDEEYERCAKIRDIIDEMFPIV